MKSKMKKNLWIVAIVCGLMNLCSCAKEVLNLEDVEEASSTSVLHVLTRTDEGGGDAQEANLPEPVCLYVFNAQGTCVRVIPDMSSVSDIRLPGGTYNVYGIAGADADRYLLPEIDEAGTDSEITLREGQQYADLMTSHASVTMLGGAEQSLTLNMTRAVFNIRRIAIKQIPDAATAVSVTIAPLYEKVLINGNYSGEEGSYEVALTEEEDGTTWSVGSADAESDIFLLPSVGNPIITISITTSEGTTNYFYQAAGELAANHKVTIEGTYTGEGTLTFDGAITGVEWDSDENVSFDFNEANTQPTDPETPDPEDPDDPDYPTPVTLPAVGSLYQTCYVLAHVDDNHVLLMAPKAVSSVIADGDNNATAKEKIETELGKWTINGITGWECPTKTDADLMVSKTTDIKDKINILLGSSESCFFEDSDGTIKKFRSNADGTIDIKEFLTDKVRVIGVATVEITN